ELGPGRGLFARDVLDWAEKKFPEFFPALRYVGVEQSTSLRAKVETVLRRHVDAGRAHVIDVVDIKSPAIVFANEFFDALPVEVLSSQGTLQIDVHDGGLAERWASPSQQELEFLDRYSVHPERGERVEVSLPAQEYMEEIAGRLQRGFFVAIDYGYTREEQLAGRHRGTLKAIRKHSVSGNAYEAPGEQDIT